MQIQPFSSPDPNFIGTLRSDQPAPRIAADKSGVVTNRVDRPYLRVYTRNMTSCYCALLRAATRKVSAVYDDALLPVGINIAQYSLLRTIERRQPVSLSELGQFAGLDRSTVGRNVRVLERRSLVQTAQGEEDKREAVVSLAPRGVQVLKNAAPIWEACQQKIKTRLGAETAQVLRDTLGAL